MVGWLKALFGGRDNGLAAVKKVKRPADGDAAIRETLRKHGDDGTAPRHTLFYFYHGDQVALRQAALAKGYAVKPTVAENGSVLETDMPVDAASFEPVRMQMETWAKEFGAEFDGWECAVEKA
jgi:hypothetical protein